MPCRRPEAGAATLTRLAFAAVAAAALAGCATKWSAPGTDTQNTGLNPQAQRITDEKILADRQTLQAVQDRLKALNQGGVSTNFYPWAKAQCWLDTAKTQYHENDRTGYVEEALAQSVSIVKALEANKTARVGQETPLIANSTMLRKDLWDAFSAERSNATTLACNALTVACGEIRLVRAGHAEEQTGWRQATPHVRMAEDAVRQAREEGKACVPAPLAPRVAAVSPPAPPQVIYRDTPAAPSREVYTLLTDALFVFDKGANNYIVSGGQRSIDDLAAKLRAYKTIDSVTVIGHTDRFGSDAYNDDLSRRRAQTISEMLRKAGVTAAEYKVEARGKREPVTTCSTAGNREAAIRCMQADRRVTIEVRGIIR
jgi:outer membrane protein OmpA-like peptidoglycan-associated protein